MERKARRGLEKAEERGRKEARRLAKKGGVAAAWQLHADPEGLRQFVEGEMGMVSCALCA